MCCEKYQIYLSHYLSQQIPPMGFEFFVYDDYLYLKSQVQLELKNLSPREQQHLAHIKDPSQKLAKIREIVD